MSDEHRGFRFNLIDAVVAGLLLLVVPLAFVAYATLRVPDPIMSAVTPTSLRIDGRLELRVTGTHFRPFLRAFVSQTGIQLTAVNLPESQHAEYLIQTPSAIELELPRDLKLGSYDIYLFDEGREVARLTPAFTLTPAPPPKVVAAPPGTLDGPTATLDLGVRFVIDPDILPAIKAGDVDLNQPEVGAPSTLAASLVSWPRVLDAKGPRSLRFENGVALPVAGPPVFDAVVRLGAVRRDDVWEYAGPQRLRVGGGFSFATSTYVMSGTITTLRAAPARSAKEVAR